MAMPVDSRQERTPGTAFTRGSTAAIATLQGLCGLGLFDGTSGPGPLVRRGELSYANDVASRRAILGGLGNFLSAFVSRNSDYDGWWLFGLLMPRLGSLEIGLLAASRPNDETEIIRFAARRAQDVFSTQMALAGVSHNLREATVTLSRTSISLEGTPNRHPSPAFEIDVTARVVTDVGPVLEKRRTLLVAEHEPSVEHRSSRRLAPG